MASPFLHDEADADWQGFWARQALALVDWYDEWETILEWNLPFSRWFVGGTLNVSYNCLDHQVAQGRGDKTAILWEGEPEPGGAGSSVCPHAAPRASSRPKVALTT